MEEESLQVRLPSPTEFASEIESKNVSAVFNGCIKNWKAFVEWNPANGGLDYLQERVGSSTVEAMLSKTAPVFYGDIRSHERQSMRNTDNGPDSLLQSGRYQDAVTDVEPSLLSGDALRQIYVAQPTFLGTKELASVNLWMNNAQSSSVALENPDFSLYPRAKCSMDYAQKVFLHADDALFIPEGWFHQVDSDDLTIPVNFWCVFLETDLDNLLPDHGCCDSNMSFKKQGLQGQDQQQKVKLHEFEPRSLQALHELVSLVLDCVRVNITDQSQCIQSTPTNDSKVSMKDECDETLTTNLFFLEDNPVAKILWTLDPRTLQSILLSMAHNFPRTLDALILHLLSPVGAEVLTRKFDEIDQQTTEGDRNKFYQGFYGAFDDQFAAFAHWAFEKSLDKYLGVNFDVPPPI
uniref:Cupin-like domain-containing protein n=1 Tax=Populus trichocarpa TaxID=3694 RepID=A0A2K2BDH4_POPTR